MADIARQVSVPQASFDLAPAARTHQPEAAPLAERASVRPAVSNRSLQRALLARRIQPRLTVSPAGDEYEQEADQLASSVLRMSAPPVHVPAVSQLRQTGGQREMGDEPDQSRLLRQADEKKPKKEDEKKVARQADKKPKKEDEKKVARQADKKPKKEDEKKVARQADKKPKKEDEKKVARQADKKPKKEDEKKVARQADKKPKKEDEKKVARQAEKKPKKEDEKKVARQADDAKKPKKQDEKTKVGRLPQPEDQRRQEEQHIQERAEGTAIPQVNHTLEAGLAAQRGAGHPLPETARAFFEPRFGRDLSQVRVHDDSWAAQAARELSAQAFTRGSDVYFGASHYQPDSDAGKRLLAHELAHTIQQEPAPALASHAAGPAESGASAGAVQRQVIQRNGATAGSSNPSPTAQPAAATGPATPAGTGGGSATTSPGRLNDAEMAIARNNLPSEGRLGEDGTTIRFSALPIPPFKLGGHRAQYYTSRPLLRNKAYNRRQDPTNQANNWRTALQAEDVSAATGFVNQILRPSAHDPAVDPNRTYFLKTTSRFGYVESRPTYVIGTPQNLAKGLVLPLWNRQGRVMGREGVTGGPHIDHVLELQVANWPEASGWGSADHINNYELVRGDINLSSGSRIESAVKTKARRFLQIVRHLPGPAPEAHGDALAKNYNLVFLRGEPGTDPEELSSHGDDYYWTREQIVRGDHVNPAVTSGRPVRTADLDAELMNQAQPHFAVFPSESGGRPSTYAWTGTGALASGENEEYLAPFRIVEKHFFPGTVGDMLGTFKFDLPADKIWQQNATLHTMPIRRIPGSQRAGYMDKRVARDALRTSAEVKGSSPIDVTDLEIGPRGLEAGGYILGNVALLRDARLQYQMIGHDFSVFRDFQMGDFNIPRPFSISQVDLRVGASTVRGLFAEGQVNFGIERVGNGFIRATSSLEHTFDAEGGFEFDSQYFRPATLSVRYVNNQWSGEGHLGIPAGRIPGIQSADISATYAQDRLEASGMAQLTVPGVRQGSLTLVYTEANGLTLGGRLLLADNIPGIRGGEINATVQQRPDSSGYELTAHGTAQPAIPGIDSQLTVDYDNGALTIEGSAAYARGMLSGSLTVGATNRPLDPEGRPLPGVPPTERFRAYGGGQVTARLAPWLQGTAGMRLLPNGELEMAGEIALPSSLSLFDEKRVERNILTVGVDIPIVGVAVAGQRVGIFATVSGGLDASAGIGPGQLREMALHITYNPAHEDQTHITGHSQLYIPAHAGLRLFIRGGVGAGIPLVSATANLEVGGSLGIEGAVQADVNVDWLPMRGLVIDALGQIYAEPKFRFDVSALVLVEAGAFGLTAELYNRRWNLAAFEYGSNLRVGARFPIHYQEGQPFDVRLSDVQFEYPQIEPRQVLTDLIARVVS